ncbi:MAG TPA: class I SAM-dependent methyltransferase [Drouetiella sp.]|jgi:2-polyprenyl-3-methyl-5-hydroxy-6-metoxy-1,4-benzoquinol methylase
MTQSKSYALDRHYEDEKLTAIYDLDSGWSPDRQFYLDLPSSSNMTILDVGCGTGLLCNEYAAKGHKVTGVEPSEAMLNIAREKFYGDEIEWVQSFAQDFDLGKTFDLIVMTGHAFQVLQTDDDVQSTFIAMQKHLKPDGLIVFESRNPDFDWHKNWNYELEIEIPTGGVVKESRKFVAMDENMLTFELCYQFKTELLTSKSVLRFWTETEIRHHLQEAGLKVEKLLGNWNGNEFTKNQSEEMIFFVRK